MEVEKKYKSIINKALEAYIQPTIVNLPEVRTELIIDKQESHFIVLDIGWQNDEFIHEWVFYIEVKEGKVWIHEDATDYNIAKALIDAGIDESDIFISFWQTPNERMSSQDAA